MEEINYNEIQSSIQPKNTNNLYRNLFIGYFILSTSFLSVYMYQNNKNISNLKEQISISNTKQNVQENNKTPENIITNNIFDPNTMKIGDKFGSFKLEKLIPYTDNFQGTREDEPFSSENYDAEFTGMVTLKGDYSLSYSPGGEGPEGYYFHFVPKEEYKKLLPCDINSINTCNTNIYINDNLVKDIFKISEEELNNFRNKNEEINIKSGNIEILTDKYLKSSYPIGGMGSSENISIISGKIID